MKAGFDRAAATTSPPGIARLFCDQLPVTVVSSYRAPRSTQPRHVLCYRFVSAASAANSCGLAANLPYPLFVERGRPQNHRDDARLTNCCNARNKRPRGVSKLVILGYRSFSDPIDQFRIKARCRLKISPRPIAASCSFSASNVEQNG